jgi:arsenate reductase-like glutaredoxin family protein
MATSNREIILFYDSRDDLGKKCNAHLAAAGKNTLSIDLSETNISSTEWTEVAGMCGKKVNDLIAEDHPAFKNLFGEDHVDLEEHDAIKVLENNPEVLVFPIAIRGKKGIQLKSTQELRKLMDTDSGEIPQP